MILRTTLVRARSTINNMYAYSREYAYYAYGLLCIHIRATLE